MALYLNYQKPHKDIGTFFKLFKARREVIDTFGDKACFHHGLYMEHRKATIAATKQPTPPDTVFPLSGLTDEENKQALASSWEEYLAALFLRLANENKFGAIKKKLDNMHLFGQNAYPKTLEEAKTYLENFQLEMVGNRQNRQQQNTAEQGVAFAQHGSEGRQIGPCHNCGRMGHLVANCPDLNDEEKMAIQQAYQNKNKGGKAKTGQAHVNVGNGAANKELQECLSRESPMLM